MKGKDSPSKSSEACHLLWILATIPHILWASSPGAKTRIWRERAAWKGGCSQDWLPHKDIPYPSSAISRVEPARRVVQCVGKSNACVFHRLPQVVHVGSEIVEQSRLAIEQIDRKPLPRLDTLQELQNLLLRKEAIRISGIQPIEQQ